MKRICSMILVLALLGQLLPVQALAEAGPQMPSSSELAAARALTGLAEDAPIYHAGMSVSSAMNAMQLSGWLDELLGNEMFSLQSAYQSIQTTLERMKAEDPGYYGIMTDTPNNRPYLPRIEKLHHQSEELREELAFYSHRLVEQSYIIDSMMERIGSDEYSDTEKARAARKLDSAAQTIRDIRDAVVQNAAGWETQIGTWMRVLQGDNIMDDQSDALSADWVYLVMAWKPVVAQAQVSTVSLYPKGETLLERLSPVRSALAETKQDVTLRVVSQKNFAISVKAAEGPIAGASVTVTQGGVSRTSETGSSGFEQGIAIFNVSDFQMDSGGCIELAMEVTAPGYRGFELRRVQLRKGQVLTYSLKKDDGSPYIYGASFQDNDILLEQYGIYYSPFNDLTRTISATVMSSGGVFCALKYTDASSGKTLYTDAKKATGGKQTVEFTAKWLQTLKPGERVSFLLGSTEESVKNDSAGETPSMLSVQRGAVDKPFFDTTGAFTSAFVPTGTGFLGVTLPKSAPSFIAGSTLSIDFPFVKYWPRLIINVDGSFSFSLGGELKDLSPYDVVGEGEEKVARWKTEDQRSLERRQNDYVEQGEKMRYRAKIGAMWDGAKSKPVSFLGKMNASVSVFMYLYGQYQHDDDGYGRIKGKGGVGMSFSFGAEMTQMTGPFFLNVGLTASVGMGFQIGIEIDTYWPQNGKLTTRATRLSKESGMIILLRLQVDVSLGVGIKGLLSVSVHGYGYVSVLIELLRSSQGLTVSARAGIYLLAEVFLLKWKITIYDMNEEKVLYTTKKNTAAYSPLRILEPFLPSAVAESGEGDQNSTSLIEKSYPKLEIEQAQTVLADISAADTEIQMLTLDGKPFAFYLEKTGTGARVRWVSLSEGKSGDFSAALSEQDGMGGLIDYDFAVSKADYRQLASGQGVSVNEMGFLCVLATPSMRAVPMTLEDGQTLEMQEPTGTIAYFIGFICQNGALTAEIEFAGDGGKVLFGRADVTSGSGQTFINPTVNATSFVKSGISYYFVNLYMERLDKQSAGRQDAGRTLLMFGRPVAVVGGTTFISQLEAIEKLQPVAPQSGANRYQVQTGAAESFGQGVGVGLSSTNYESWYALEGEGESPLTGETRLMHHVMGYSGGKAKGLIELDKGQICYYKAVIGEEGDKSQTDMLFYLMQNPGDETKQYHLKGIRVTHDLYNERIHYQETGNRYMALSEATLSDYDVIVPASSFDVTTIDGTTYLYWLEAVEPENERDARRYRISGVVYDPNSDRINTAKDKANAGAQVAQKNESLLQGYIDTMKTQILSTGTKLYTDQYDGGLVLESADGKSAVKLTGSGILIASTKIGDDFQWTLAIDGHGAVADTITTGVLNASIVKIFGTSAFYWDSANIHIVNPEDTNRQIRIGLYDGVHYGIGFTTDGGQTWQNAIGFNGVSFSSGSVSMAALSQEAIDEINAHAKKVAEEEAKAAKDAADAAAQAAADAQGKADAAAQTAADAQSKADAAKAEVESATAAANAAQNAANAAEAEAIAAAGIAADKGRVWFQTEAPEGNLNDLWIDTTNGANTPKRWDGENWVSVTDKAAVDAANAAVNAKGAADAAAQAAAEAQDAAAAAQGTADAAQGTADAAQGAADAAQGTANAAAQAAADAKAAAEKAQGDVDALGKTVTTIDQRTTATSIVSTVRESTEYKGDINAMVKQTTFEQNARDVTAIFNRIGLDGAQTGIVKADIDGVKVTHSDFNGYTQQAADGFKMYDGAGNLIGGMFVVNGSAVSGVQRLMNPSRTTFFVEVSPGLYADEEDGLRFYYGNAVCGILTGIWDGDGDGNGSMRLRANDTLYIGDKNGQLSVLDLIKSVNRVHFSYSQPSSANAGDIWLKPINVD